MDSCHHYLTDLVRVIRNFPFISILNAFEQFEYLDNRQRNSNIDIFSFIHFEYA